MIKKWYEEAVDYGLLVLTVNGVSSVFYKGFKMSNKNGEYTIQNIRENDFYTTVDDDSLKILNEYGFIQGADNIAYERNVGRTNKFKRQLEKLYSDKLKFKTVKQQESQKFKNIIDAIYTYVDKLQFYKSKVLQHENKYKILTTD